MDTIHNGEMVNDVLMTLTVDDDVCMISGKEEPYHPDSKSQTTKVKQVIKDTEQFNFVAIFMKTRILEFKTWLAIPFK